MFKSVTVFVLLFLFSLSSYAIPPSWVYRLDSRPPELIFNNGFLSWGGNNDFISHLTGSSLDDRTDAYISTSSSQEFIDQMARDSLADSPVVWEYTIRPSDNFFSAMSSLDEAISYADHNPTMTYLRGQYRRLRVQVELEAEYTARWAIQANQIYQVREITADADNNIHYGDYQLNPNYDNSIAPAINTGTLPTNYPQADGFLTSNSSLSSSSSSESLFSPSASFLAGCSKPSLSGLKKTSNNTCNYKKVDLNISLKKETAKLLSALGGY